MKINSKYRLNASGFFWLEFYGTASSDVARANSGVFEAIEKIDEAIEQLENQLRQSKNSQVPREYINKLKAQQRILDNTSKALSDLYGALHDESKKIQSTPMPEEFDKLDRTLKNRYRR